MTKQIFTTNSAQETQALAVELLHSSKPTVIALIGPLGSGKTTFAQAIGESLGIKRMVSPTYVLLRQYSPATKDLETLYHADLYRLTSKEEIRDLGLKEIWSDPRALLLIEWPEKILDQLPPGTLKVEFRELSGDHRRITVESL